MTSVVFTEPAEYDLLDIEYYIFVDLCNSRAAQRISDGILDAAEKCFQKITVIIKTAGFTHFCNTNALCKKGFGNGNASCGNVFVDRCAGRGFKDTADIRFTEKSVQPAYFSG